MLERPLYRGEIVYGRLKKAYGRELGKRSAREKGMIPRPEASWLRRDAPASGALLEGLIDAVHLVASPTGLAKGCIAFSGEAA
jgi:hypothetical protein